MPWSMITLFIIFLLFYHITNSRSLRKAAIRVYWGIFDKSPKKAKTASRLLLKAAFAYCLAAAVIRLRPAPEAP